MRYLSFVSLFVHVLNRFTWAVSFSCTAARWPATHAVEFCEISSSSEGCSCESLTACCSCESPLRRRLSAEYCETSCERLTCVSFAVCRLLPNASRLLPLTCDASTFAECCEASLPHLPGSSRAPSSLSLHALSSQARHWLEVRTIVFWTLTIASMNCT